MIIERNNIFTRYEFLDDIGFTVLKVIHYHYMRKCDFYVYDDEAQDMKYLFSVGY